MSSNTLRPGASEEPTTVRRLHRDAEATRERILDTALAEFSELGFAGARIKSIACRAAVNVRMLYYYFGEKEDLFRAILRRQFNKSPVEPPERTVPLGLQTANWFRKVADNPHWVRLLQWEALETTESTVVEEEERRRRWEEMVQHLRAEQAAGRLDPSLDADLMLVAMVSLASFPVVSAPLVRMVTGSNPTDKQFKKRYAAFLQHVYEKLMEDNTADDAVAEPGAGRSKTGAGTSC